VSRLKVMSQLDIAERRKPQDGKIPFKRFGPLDVELRIATIPTANGLEDVVMRVLAAATPKPVDQLGFSAEALDSIKRVMARPHGLFLVCGPTGSGKTTTLHSLLGFLNTPDLKIWTAEDPIEITQAGLRQVQMNPKIGWTFAAAMRSFMRADPDVIMVGEMRDAETSKIAIEASLTGHLVLSTLHTNNAAESVVRLLDLGMDPFNFADALLGVLAQRLVRTLCMECRTRLEPSVRDMEALADEYCEGSALDRDTVLRKWREQKVTLYQPKGCQECDQTGYKGRVPVYELMVADAGLKRLIQTRSPVAEITAAALGNGMRTLKQDGIDKVIKGHTDMQQVRAV
jgi:type II secretory ATPase GspE/PulE/Tfp pilus assembly ATPase PilB-like protein